jgi:hypothetical protein
MLLIHDRNGISRSHANGTGLHWLLFVAFLPGAVLIGCKKQASHASLAPRRSGPIHDLAAVRAGNELWLSWSIPKKETRKLAVNGSVSARICRRESAQNICNVVGPPLLLAPGGSGSFSEQLPDGLVAGPPRLLYYSVELFDRDDRSVGLSNDVATLAGAPLPEVQGFTAERIGDGILLRWTRLAPSEEPTGTILRLHRTRLIETPPRPEPAGASPASPPQSSGGDRVIEVDRESDHALDAQIQPGNTYEYTAHRVFQVRVGDQTLELAGQLSMPVEVSVPPTPPR